MLLVFLWFSLATGQALTSLASIEQLPPFPNTTSTSASQLADPATTLLTTDSSYFPTNTTGGQLGFPTTSSGTSLSDIGSTSSLFPLELSSSPETTSQPADLASSSAAQLTGTITTAPSGFSTVVTSNSAWSSHTWLTTTAEDGSSTVVPVIFCPGCGIDGGFVILSGLPPIPNILIKLPGLPEFHLPCIEIFGVMIAGKCDPVNDDPDHTETSSISSASRTTSSSTSSSSTSSVSYLRIHTMRLG